VGEGQEDSEHTLTPCLSTIPEMLVRVTGNAWLTLLVIQFAVTCLTLCLLHEPTPPPEPDQAACREIIAPQEPTPPPEPDQAACREIIAPQETDGEQHGRGGAWRREQPELTVALAAGGFALPANLPLAHTTPKQRTCFCSSLAWVMLLLVRFGCL
jgi:hypothetical protein